MCFSISIKKHKNNLNSNSLLIQKPQKDFYFIFFKYESIKEDFLLVKYKIKRKGFLLLFKKTIPKFYLFSFLFF